MSFYFLKSIGEFYGCIECITWIYLQKNRVGMLHYFIRFFLFFFLIWVHVYCVASDHTYSLSASLTRALLIDPEQGVLAQRQTQLAQKSIIVKSFPEPVLYMGFANVPVDSWDLDREAMTQVVLGVKQTLPRRDTRGIKAQQLLKLRDAAYHAQQSRYLNVREMVGHLWLDIYNDQAAAALLKKERVLFEHLVDVAQAHYSSASGGIRQDDILRAQLELTGLDDRTLSLLQRRDEKYAVFREWLSDPNATILGDTLPDIPLHAKVSEALNSRAMNTHVHDSFVRESIASHPLVAALDRRLEAAKQTILLAKKNRQPQWGVHGRYGLRERSLSGEERPDFFSITLAVSAPLFQGARLSSEKKLAQAEYAALKSERLVMVRQLQSKYQQTLQSYRGLKSREHLYDQRLLAAMNAQAASALMAYTSEDGDFSEVERARIAEVNAKVERLNLQTQVLKAILTLNSFHEGEMYED